MTSLFEVLAATDDEEQERLTGNRAVIAAQTRVRDRFSKFLDGASSWAERDSRIGLVDPAIREIVANVCKEYDFGNENLIYLAATVAIGGGHAADCSCGFCENKGSFGKDKDDDKEEEGKDKDTDGDDFEDKISKTAKVDINPRSIGWGSMFDQPMFREAAMKESNQYIEERDGKWVITQKGTGKVLSTHDSKEKAEASFAAMEMNKHSHFKIGCTCDCSDCKDGEHCSSDECAKTSSIHEADGFSFCKCDCDGCDSGNHCESDECISTKHSGNPGTNSGEKKSRVAAPVADADSYQSDTLDMGDYVADESGLSDVGSPKIDKSRVPGQGADGIPGESGLSPIDVPSQRHPSEVQDIHETPEYWNSIDDPSETGKRVDAGSPLQPEFTNGDNTDTWTGTEGQASPVTNESINSFTSSVVSNWVVVN